MISHKTKLRVNKIVLLMSILYGAFAMVDDSSWLEGSTFSFTHIDQCINKDAQEDATPWLSLNFGQHRNFRTFAKETTNAHFIYQQQLSGASGLSRWSLTAIHECLSTVDLAALICTFRI